MYLQCVSRLFTVLIAGEWHLLIELLKMWSAEYCADIRVDKMSCALLWWMISCQETNCGIFCVGYKVVCLTFFSSITCAYFLNVIRLAFEIKLILLSLKYKGNLISGWLILVAKSFAGQDHFNANLFLLCWNSFSNLSISPCANAYSVFKSTTVTIY